ncbi:hypothetical protein RQP46_001230 [Phenoliferia psychrophenolica]
MSLPMRRPIETVTLDSDSDDEPAQKAPRKSVKASSAPAQEAPSKLQERSDSLAGGSRNDMERERVARQQAREATGTAQPPPTRKVASGPRIATLSSIASTSASSTSTSALNNHSNARRGPNAAAPNPRASDRYWEPRILRVSNEYAPDSDSLSFKKVLGPKKQLESALVGAFMLKVDWVLKNIPDDVPVLLIKAKKSDEKERKLGGVGNEVREGVEQNLSHLHHQTTRIAPRPESEYGCFHTKIIILTYKTFLRVVVGSANLTKADWSKLDNMVFVQDFPRLPASPAPLGRSLEQTAFSTSLLGVLRNLSVPERLLNTILTGFDFSKASEIQLHYKWEKMEAGGGLLSLAAAVKACNFSSGGIWEIEAANWLSNMYSACTGVTAKSYFVKGVQKTQPGLQLGRNLPIKVAFPTHAEVEASHGGLGAGSATFPKDNWTDTFPKHLMYRAGCKRERVVSHTKCIVAIHRPGPIPHPGYTPEGWFYTGSHNFTPAAWGELQSGTYDPALKVLNHELGVLIPIRAKTLAEVERKMDVLASYKRPLVPYSASDVPFFHELYKGGSRNDMERERIARQQAREATGVAQPPPTRKVASSPRIATLSSIASTSASSTSTSSSAPNNDSTALRGLDAAAPSPRTSDRYWEYRILRVSNDYVADSESLSFDQVLGPKEQLESALVGAFVLQVDWVLKHLPDNVPVLLLKAESSSNEKERELGGPENELWEGVEQDLSSHLRRQTTRIAPLTEDADGCFHTKIITLTYKSFIRLCIPTANLTNGDWSRLDNMLYIQDFPRITSPALLKRSLAQTAFATSLLGVLRKLSVPQRLLETILTGFNFSKAKEIQLVVSNQGMHFNWDRMEAGGGLLSLAAAVKACNFSSGGIWEIEAAGSSMGKFSDRDHENWLSNMYSACTGVSASAKSIVAIHRPGPDPEPGYTPEGWFYTGSHNLGGSLADIGKKMDELVNYERPLVPYSASDVPFFQELYKEQ